MCVGKASALLTQSRGKGKKSDCKRRGNFQEEALQDRTIPHHQRLPSEAKKKEEKGNNKWWHASKSNITLKT
ncbi:hypothetical protein BDA96_06G134600 [Sorghum bicolor]|uniref:Uncharacterized protein n=1 Tax=Sorghum bicolor TaxID=4558 RepID=A0A921QR72_SORBI|nr:hypothetical protein BDA96_06G134600 [Sorghum bicolor]